MSEILLPCLVATPTGLLRVPRSDMHHFVRGRSPGGNWDFKHGATPSMRVSFLIQRDGCLRDVVPLRARRRKVPFNLAGKFRKFLKALPESELFDERRFREFWDEAGYPLPPGAWEESLS